MTYYCNGVCCRQKLDGNGEPIGYIYKPNRNLGDVSKYLKGELYYCRTCVAYLDLTLLTDKKRCGCCNSKVRFKPRKHVDTEVQIETASGLNMSVLTV